MRLETLYWLLDPEASGTGGRIFRCAHHTLLTAGIGIMVANTTPAWRQHWAAELDLGFRIVCVFFVAEYILRLAAVPGAPGSEHRGEWRSRLSWALSIGGLCDFLGILPGALALVISPRHASVAGFVWSFKLVRYAPALASLQRVIRDSRHALLSVLLGFCIVLLLSASLAYLLERTGQPEVFGSIPAALWWRS